jgi:hypothetical protein
MFNIEEYKAFVASKLRRTIARKDAISTTSIINFCCQWDKTPTDFFSISTTRANRQLKLALAVDEKPTGVPYNKYLLYSFGYSNCKNCKKTLHISNFYTDKTRWNSLDDRCSICSNNRVKTWRNNNPGKAAAQRASRRAHELSCTPSWLTNEQKANILHFYVEAWQLGLEVDHIVPICGENVCGLHVPWNLQLLDRSANASKGNKFDSW